VTERAAKRPAEPPKGIQFPRIPPEDAAFLVMVLLDVLTTLWQQERAKWSMRKLTLQRNAEFALGHEQGFTTLLRRSRPKRS
jgi:hypothetical protein